MEFCDALNNTHTQQSTLYWLTTECSSATVMPLAVVSLHQQHFYGDLKNFSVFGYFSGM